MRENRRPYDGKGICAERTRPQRLRWLAAFSTGAAGFLAIACEPDITEPTDDGSFIFVGAGDIAECGGTRDEQTASLIDSLLDVYANVTIFTAGDNVYEDGTAQEYRDCYEPSWGRFKSRTWATIGNHEYQLGNADPTFDYFGARVGPRDLGYYSLDIGTWHIVMLNSNDGAVSTDPGSEQELWLRADLAATAKPCIMAVFHHPRFHSCPEENGQGGCDFTTDDVRPFWQALYEFGADVVVSGHRHRYERFALQDPDGNRDPTGGIRQFIVGTGGRSISIPTVVHPNSEVQTDEPAAYGVIKFKLLENAYDWEFIPIPGKSFTDSGRGSCIPAPPGAT